MLKIREPIRAKEKIASIVEGLLRKYKLSYEEVSVSHFYIHNSNHKLKPFKSFRIGDSLIILSEDELARNYFTVVVTCNAEPQDIEGRILRNYLNGKYISWVAFAPSISGLACAFMFAFLWSIPSCAEAIRRSRPLPFSIQYWTGKNNVTFTLKFGWRGDKRTVRIFKKRRFVPPAELNGHLKYILARLFYTAI